jgi:hypothetical protein
LADNSYFYILTRAINDMAENGYTSVDRVAYWQEELRQAAERMMLSDADMERMLITALQGVYARMVDRNGAIKYHPGISRFTYEQLKPHLRSELDRRIMAAADLIKLNKKQQVELTLRRFSGWATSIPKGGAAEPNKKKIKAEIRAPLRKLPFEERRVLIDQGHKLVSSINEIISVDGGAIGGIWHSHFRQPGYDYRPDHKERDGVFYLVRGSWADKRGYLSRGTYKYIDQITRPGEEVFCRCYYTYVYALRQVPEDALSKKGRDELARVRAVVAEL